jgi:hypothetical protein
VKTWPKIGKNTESFVLSTKIILNHFCKSFYY